MRLHERLRELRSERGLRLKDIAERCGVSVPYLSDLERGRANPSLDTLQTLAGAYELSVNDLLMGVDFYGNASAQSLPLGLKELLDDPILGAQITPEWVESLARIELRGRRPRDKQDWYEIFLHLRRILS
ncbi:helix-turn-helix domain-containing protein [Deinococcus ficus]|uniref:Transcriptional regulator n=1 Tax=Deinococcus ficus TaxID=317577 RepID=A0A221T3H9_9DEIO|nr:helix-turn-helix transcriptional regulator [Deinococcus ficus]ASN83438.1 transcriptional regulator [Deinococcus ficus]